MRVTVSARQRLDPGLREYAEEKLARIARHAPNLLDARVILDGESGRAGTCSADVTVTLEGGAPLVAEGRGATMREAIDRLADRIDEQVRRHRDRVTTRRERTSAAGPVTAPEATSPADASASPVVGAGSATIPHRRVRVRPLALEDAVAEMEGRSEAYFLFLDELSGQTCLLLRGGDGSLELVLADAR